MAEARYELQQTWAARGMTDDLVLKASEKFDVIMNEYLRFQWEAGQGKRTDSGVDDRCWELFEQVVDILRENRLSREETRALYKTNGDNDLNHRIEQAADQIVELFLMENLSIADSAVIAKWVEEMYY